LEPHGQVTGIPSTPFRSGSQEKLGQKDGTAARPKQKKTPERVLRRPLIY
jgi:hypothetical protein